MDRASEAQHEAASPRLAGNIEKRDRRAEERDHLAERRDRAAEERDRAAEASGSLAEEIEREMAAGSTQVDAALKVAARLREEVTALRTRAAEERRLAARDRALAAAERAEAVAELRRAHLDDLTGAYRRTFGQDMLRMEIERARRTNGRLALAIVDVDGLKEVNDTQGHLAGDQLLRDVVAVIRANIRSYEPVVRWGGDEFVFAVAGIDLPEAARRVAVMRADLARRPSRGGFTVGVAELCPGDRLTDLVERADAALVRTRRERRTGRFPPAKA